MASPQIKSFRATLEPLPGSLGWIIARVPFDIHTSWPKLVRRRVKVEIVGQTFRTSLFPFADKSGHFVLINNRMRQAADASAGSSVDLTLAPDLEQREAVIPPELATLLKSEKALSRWFATNSEAMRREIGKWVADPKTPATRQRRAEQMAERLLLAMEAETTLPPIIERAFGVQPVARRGWDAMTPTQRRNHLLGLFYYQSLASQQKRLKMLLEDAVRRAG